ncbi:MAG TPA: alpha/beta fold hydrolase [Polyangia bacterium]|jgi:medium-chain acyl-[acyl-carrier-protein] hydrolase|nr:alpha/beta fold hydrolase [Polyangia bacterium]
MSEAAAKPRPKSPWVVIPRPVIRPRLSLFCLPYAGGGANIFQSWPTQLPPDIEVAAIQLPGRGMRFREPVFRQIGPLCDALEAALEPFLSPAPFALFGHSMGATIAFELCRRLRRRRGPMPVHLIVSGRGAPQFVDEGPPIYKLPEAEFIRKISSQGGTPREVLDNAELMSLLLPILRADFEVVETWQHTPEPPLDVPITVLGGHQDELAPPHELAGWREHTTREFATHLFPGGHFFLHSAAVPVLTVVARTLTQAHPAG